MLLLKNQKDYIIKNSKRRKYTQEYISKNHIEFNSYSVKLRSDLLNVFFDCKNNFLSVVDTHFFLDENLNIFFMFSSELKKELSVLLYNYSELYNNE